MVVEAVGGSWGPAAATALVDFAKTKALLTGEPQERVLQQLLETLGVILHRENARAVLNRTRMFSTGLDGLLAAATTLQADAASTDFQFQ